MRHKVIFWTVFFLSKTVFSQEINAPILPYKKNITEKIFQGQIFSESKVKSFSQDNQKMQTLHFSIAGLHPKSCTYALKTLSLYEEYSHFLNFVKMSRYDEKSEELNFTLSHLLLPYDMGLKFKLPRIKIPGVYPFSFEVGLLKNLNGKIHVIENNNRCLFYSTANWIGPTTGINDTIFELFSQALSKLSMEILFRISSSLSH